MEQVSIIGIDLAKRSFQLHGARADGSVAFRRKVSRERLLYILGAQQRCVVAMEACASAHYWGREILKLGHDVRLVPPIYVKPFVKRQKNDAADAEVGLGDADADRQPGPLPHGAFQVLAECRELLRYSREIEKTFVDRVFLYRRRPVPRRPASPGCSCRYRTGGCR